MKQHKTFYLAGSYANREELQEMVSRIEELSRFGDWKCNARWLSGSHDDISFTVCANEDVEDIKSADAIIVVHGQSTLGGMWCELGMAIMLNKPVMIYIPPEELTRDLPVFAYVNGIKSVSALKTCG